VDSYGNLVSQRFQDRFLLGRERANARALDVEHAQ
jgi:hypothetical protein